MNGVVTRTRSESGQALVFMVFALLTIVGMAAIVVDGGQWLQAQRHLQTAADAAALAGAQDLPLTGTAGSTASSYAQTNDAGISTTSTFPSDSPCAPNACIDVAAVTQAATVHNFAGGQANSVPQAWKRKLRGERQETTRLLATAR